MSGAYNGCGYKVYSLQGHIIFLQLAVGLHASAAKA